MFNRFHNQASNGVESTKQSKGSCGLDLVCVSQQMKMGSFRLGSNVHMCMCLTSVHHWNCYRDLLFANRQERKPRSLETPDQNVYSRREKVFRTSGVITFVRVSSSWSMATRPPSIEERRATSKTRPPIKRTRASRTNSIRATIVAEGSVTPELGDYPAQSSSGVPTSLSIEFASNARPPIHQLSGTAGWTTVCRGHAATDWRTPDSRPDSDTASVRPGFTFCCNIWE